MVQINRVHHFDNAAGRLPLRPMTRLAVPAASERVEGHTVGAKGVWMGTGWLLRGFGMNANGDG